MRRYHIMVHIGHQFCVQPGKLSYYLQLLLCSLPESPFPMATIHEQTAKSRELSPANIKSWRNRFPRKSGNIRPYNIITQVSVFQYTLYGRFKALDSFQGNIHFFISLLQYHFIGYPFVFLIAYPIYRGSINGRKTFGMKATVYGSGKGNKLRILGKAMRVFVPVIMVHISSSGHNSLGCPLIKYWYWPKLVPKKGCCAIQLPSINSKIKNILLQPTPPIHGIITGIIYKTSLPFPPFIGVTGFNQKTFIHCPLIPIL